MVLVEQEHQIQSQDQIQHTLEVVAVVDNMEVLEEQAEQVAVVLEE